ncbi:biliverdin-producing heme oxygenase [Exilibacterium tricleocarpae]|uniref:Biliverdin-producing heme oxygenase n=1 Tax=Exilibacterium tricleocarpae TaxID=2591008 RepID=A0A545SN66_9GAMM|nr:biliverdin-producing heme oxygenase [Exilibacterium tricleocarpae]TQV66306.1 biliverdin-producing heme oxygenase [Exilibacterium tricleocarpae]
MIAKVIKEHTHLAHTQVERRIGRLLFDPTLCAGRYCHILQRFYHIHSQLQEQFELYPLTRQLMKDRSKLSWLQQDLVALNCDSEPVSLAGESCPGIQLQGQAAALGAMYVAEGSTLGGKVIAQRLKALPWLNVAAGCPHFFQSYGGARGEKWREFLEVLNGYARDNPQQQRAVLSGAETTFRFFKAMFVRLKCSCPA